MDLDLNLDFLQLSNAAVKRGSDLQSGTHHTCTCNPQALIHVAERERHLIIGKIEPIVLSHIVELYQYARKAHLDNSHTPCDVFFKQAVIGLRQQQAGVLDAQTGHCLKEIPGLLAILRRIVTLERHLELHAGLELRSLTDLANLSPYAFVHQMFETIWLECCMNPFLVDSGGVRQMIASTISLTITMWVTGPEERLKESQWACYVAKHMADANPEGGALNGSSQQLQLLAKMNSELHSIQNQIQDHAAKSKKQSEELAPPSKKRSKSKAPSAPSSEPTTPKLDEAAKLVAQLNDPAPLDPIGSGPAGGKSQPIAVNSSHASERSSKDRHNSKDRHSADKPRSSLKGGRDRDRDHRGSSDTRHKSSYQYAKDDDEDEDDSDSASDDDEESQSEEDDDA